MDPATDDGATIGAAFRMGLACAEGLTNRAVAKRLRVSSNSVCKWRKRFHVPRLPGLTDEPRPGAPRKATDDRIVDVITRTLEGPPAHATQWLTRSLADVAGLSKATIAHLADVWLAVASPRHIQTVGEPPARQTHDYMRNGTTLLFAALEVATGKVVGQCHRQRHQELLNFLERVDAQLPPDRDVHVIMNNYGTRKAPKVILWFVRHPRYHLHVPPTSAS